MADNRPEARSFIMSQVKGKNTKPELIVRKHLFKNGFRFRLHDTKLSGKPDVVLPKYRIVIFVNGCFWHGHVNCRHATLPKSNFQYWQTKIQNTILRDAKSVEQLINLGWTAIIVWECELHKKRSDNTFENLVSMIFKNVNH